MRDEDDLRTALRTLERYAPDPGAVLAAMRAQKGASAGSRRASSARRHPRGHARWLGPVAAAAAVLAIVAGSLIVAHMPAGNRAASHHRLAVVTAAQLAAAGVPAYYVTLDSIGRTGCCSSPAPFAPRTDAVLRSTRSGARIATIRPPKPYATFVAVTATGDDRTFVVAAQRAAYFPLDQRQFPATRFYTLTVNPGARTRASRARLTPLPIPVQPRGATVFGISVSPDGSKLAMVSAAPASPNSAAVHVFSMATGADRAYNGYAFRDAGPAAYPGFLSWAADSRMLEFIGWGHGHEPAVWLLNTAAKGHGLTSDSRLAVRRPAGVAPTDFDWRGAIISPDGTAIIAVLEIVRHFKIGKGFNVYEQLVRYSARTGVAQRSLNLRSVPDAGYEQVLWASRSGRVLIVNGTGRDATGAEIYLGHRRMTFPWSAKTQTAAW